MIGPIARIMLRYAAAALVTYGVVSPDIGDQVASDPDLMAVVGACVALGVEGTYWAARKLGWST